MVILLEKLRALADSNRFRIVMMLMERSLCVCELLQVLDISGGTLSNHLKILKHAGLVKQQKDGRWIEYEILNEEVYKFLYSIELNLDDKARIDEDRSVVSRLTRDVCSSSSRNEK